jgi:hypothetical protein
MATASGGGSQVARPQVGPHLLRRGHFLDPADGLGDLPLQGELSRVRQRLLVPVDRMEPAVRGHLDVGQVEDGLGQRRVLLEVGGDRGGGDRQVDFLQELVANDLARQLAACGPGWAPLPMPSPSIEAKKIRRPIAVVKSSLGIRSTSNAFARNVNGSRRHWSRSTRGS